MLMAVVSCKKPNHQAVFHILFIVLTLDFAMKKLSKIEAEKQIEKFFKNIRLKNPEEIKKIKKLAMRYNIQLGNLRKKFCKKCFTPRLKVIGIKNKVKRIQCENCGYISRWKIKNL